MLLELTTCSELLGFRATGMTEAVVEESESLIMTPMFLSCEQSFSISRDSEILIFPLEIPLTVRVIYKCTLSSH
jgi:hypothetical protein